MTDEPITEQDLARIEADPTLAFDVGDIRALVSALRAAWEANAGLAVLHNLAVEAAATHKRERDEAREALEELLSANSAAMLAAADHKAGNPDLLQRYEDAWSGAARIVSG